MPWGTRDLFRSLSVSKTYVSIGYQYTGNECLVAYRKQGPVRLVDRLNRPKHLVQLLGRQVRP